MRSSGAAQPARQMPVVDCHQVGWTQEMMLTCAACCVMGSQDGAKEGGEVAANGGEDGAAAPRPQQAPPPTTIEIDATASGSLAGGCRSACLIRIRLIFDHISHVNVGG